MHSIEYKMFHNHLRIWIIYMLFFFPMNAFYCTYIKTRKIHIWIGLYISDRDSVDIRCSLLICTWTWWSSEGEKHELPAEHHVQLVHFLGGRAQLAQLYENGQPNKGELLNWVFRYTNHSFTYQMSFVRDFILNVEIFVFWYRWILRDWQGESTSVNMASEAISH